MSRSRGRAAAGLAALVALLALVIGLPALLLALGGSPLPSHLPSAAQLGHGLLHRDSASVVLAVVRDVSWLAWAAFTCAVLAEVQAVARRRTAPRLHLGGLQSMAGRLVALAALAFSTAPVGTLLATPQPVTAAMVTTVPAGTQAAPALAAAAPAAVAPDRVLTLDAAMTAGPAPTAMVASATGSTTGSSTTGSSPTGSPTGAPLTTGAPAPAAPAQEDAVSSQGMSMAFYQLVTVRPGDCLWTIAQHYLGDGDRYTEIVSLNLGHDMGSGQAFTDPSVILPGWVLHVPAESAGHGGGHGGGGHGGSGHGGSGHGDTAGSHHESGAHTGHPSSHAHYQHPHHAASASGNGHGTPHTLTSMPSPAAASQGGSARTVSADSAAVSSPQQSRLELIAAFGTGVLAGGAAVSLSRLRHRQRQGRRRGRRIPLPVSAPVAEAEQRLNLAAACEPVTALRVVLHRLACALVAAGAQLPDITALRLQPAYLDLLLASPAIEPPPAPFSVPGGYQGMTWRMWLADEQDSYPEPAGDLLPGLLTIGAAADGYVLVDLEHLQVTEVAGARAAALLRSAAAELVTGQLAGWYDLILVGYPELEALGGRGTCCDTLDAALDQLAAKAVTLRRRLGDVPLADVRYHRLTEPGDEDWALTLLVSSQTPTSAQLAMLADLAADPGGIAALVPAGAQAPDGHREPALIELTEAADGQPALARVWPLQIEAAPTPLDDADYDALTSLFATAGEDGDVAADDPPYSRWTWPDDVIAATEAAVGDPSWDEPDEAPQDAAGRGGPGETASTGEPASAGGLSRRAGRTAEDGLTEDGLTEDRAAQHGAAQDGATQDGAAQDGPGQDGPGQDDPVMVGQVHWAAPPQWLADEVLTADEALSDQVLADQELAGGRADAAALSQGLLDRAQPGEDPPWDADPAWDPHPIWDPHPVWDRRPADGPAPASRGPVSSGQTAPAPAGVVSAESGQAPADGGVAPPGQDVLRIGVLGSFTINGQPGALLPAQSQLVLALALNGRSGLSNQQLCYLLGADPDHPKPSDSLRQLIVRTRRQLGQAPEGREWIEHLGGGQYALHPAVRFDWADFDRLTTDGMRARDAQLLRRALRLIRGRPFTGCYYWWLDLATTETVRAQIVDGADVLAALEIAAGDPAAAARAARTGLAGDAAAEQLWRALMRAEHAAGNLAGVREAWNRCLDAISDIAPDGEPHPGTAALYQELLAASGARSGWVRGMTES